MTASRKGSNGAEAVSLPKGLVNWKAGVASGPLC